ncbi:hypothetical protein M0R45_016617 [Rubus argutus]|uniref:Uncharacterized protein n=1 Tax=Rubus argutus TaxID=59490 RepID=A0AAW1XTL5_RUBAR
MILDNETGVGEMQTENNHITLFLEDFIAWGKEEPLQHQEEEKRQPLDHDALAHNPSAPPDELFDISTTVDPSYVISLIRKLPPANASSNHNSHSDVSSGPMQGLNTAILGLSNTDDMENSALTPSIVPPSSKDTSVSMEIIDDFHKNATHERENEAEPPGHNVPVGEEAWEEYGCILWDLSSSKTHAELLGLFDVFPFTSDDLEARSGLWNIVTRLLVRVRENEMNSSALQQYVSVLVSKCDVIEDDLVDCQLGGLGLKARTTVVTTVSHLKSCLATAHKVFSILNQWTASKDYAKENENNINIARLLDCCCKHSEDVPSTVSHVMET